MGTQADPTNPTEPGEIHYRLGPSVAGQRPGAHAGRTLGSGLLFAGHRRLVDHPDPRRLDVRASLRDPRGDWWVRLARQAVAARVQLLVDVSASMHVGEPRRKLDVVADFVGALAFSTHRAGDLLGMIAFDGVLPHARDELHVPPGRRGADILAPRLRALSAPARPQDPQGRGWLPWRGDQARPASGHAVKDADAAAAGLLDAARRTGGREGLVFLVSDFHGFDDATLRSALDALAPAQVVPVLVWHPEERQAPSGRGLVQLSDAEQGGHRSFWLRPSLSRRWAQAVTDRQAHLAAVFAAADFRLYDLLAEGLRFDAERLTRYFLQGLAPAVSARAPEPPA